MAKQGGLGDGLLIDQYDLSDGTQSVGDIGGGPAPGDFTPISKTAMFRLGLQLDGRIETTLFFDDATDSVHDAVSSLPTADRQVTYLRGTSLGSPAACLIVKQLNYDGERSEDGMLVATVQGQIAQGYPLQWGEQHTAGRRVDTTATNGTAVDAGASTAHGLTAYLHVLGFTGTSVTVKLQESSDNGGADAWADVVGGGFAAATGPGVQRIQTANGLTVERYLRVVTTGTFTSADFVVVVCRHEVAVSF